MFIKIEVYEGDDDTSTLIVQSPSTGFEFAHEDLYKMERYVEQREKKAAQAKAEETNDTRNED